MSSGLFFSAGKRFTSASEDGTNFYKLDVVRLFLETQFEFLCRFPAYSGETVQLFRAKPSTGSVVNRPV